MTLQTIIDKTVQVISQLPEDKASEISDFADFIMKKHEEQMLKEHIQKLVQESESFSFLDEEEEIYTLDDLKEKY